MTATATKSASAGKRKTKPRSADNGVAVSLTGRVDRITYGPTERGWLRARLETTRDELKKIGIVGGSRSIEFNGVLDPAIIQRGAQITVRGTREDHPKYGTQFKAIDVAVDRGIASGGLARLIADNPAVRGIGPAKAQQIISDYVAEAFDGTTNIDLLLDVCKNKSEDIAKKYSVKKETIEAIALILEEDAVLFQARTRLKAAGFTNHQAGQWIEAFGWESLQMFESNPYRAIDVLDGFGFTRVDQMAQKMGIEKGNRNRLRAGILYVLQKDLEAGNTWMPYGGADGVLALANKTLALDTLDAGQQIAGVISEMIAGGDIIVRDVPDNAGASAVGAAPGDKALALPAPHTQEQFLWKIFKQHGHAAPGHGITADAVGDTLTRLNDDQRAAVINALQYRIACHTGGAGTGKTYIIQTLVEIFSERGLTIECCAPSGRAAQRITETISAAVGPDFESKTIHRLLGYNGNTWEYGQGNPINADVVVVDEFSMVDVSLAMRLFKAIDWNRTSVVLVGDHNQLPPVGAGFPLRDIVKNNLIPVKRLTQVVRQAGILKRNAIAVLKGTIEPTADRTPDNAINPADAHGGDPKAMLLPWYVFDLFPSMRGASGSEYEGKSFTDPGALRHFLYFIVNQQLQESFGFDLRRDFQILCPQNTGSLGVIEINHRLQEIIQRKLFERTIPSVEDRVKSAGVASAAKLPYQYYIGDKIIQLKNVYQGEGPARRLHRANGEIGFVEDIGGTKKASTLVVRFMGSDGLAERVHRITPAEQRDIALGYAITVHKFQGSQIPCAIFLCHSKNQYMLDKNLAYTAVTRSSRVTIILGDDKGLKKAVKKSGASERRTWLGTFALANPNSQ